MPSFPGSTADNIELARLDGTRPFTGDVSMGAHKIANIQNAVAPQDVPSFSQVQGLIAVGAPPTGSAGGDLTGTYPNPTVKPDGVTFDKMQNITTDRLIGRDTASTGDPEEISLNSTLEFTGSSSIQRAALSGDITAAAGSNVTAITAGVIVDADINSSAGITHTKLANIATDRILGRDTAGTGPLEALTVSGGLEFTGSTGIQRSAISGDVTIPAGATTSIVTDLTIASEVQGSVLYFNGTNWVQLSPGTSGYALTTNGAAANPTWTNVSGLGGPPTGAAGGDLTGSYPNPSIGTDKITFAKMQNIATDRLIGRDTAGTGDPEEISLNSTLEFTGSGSIQRAALSGDITSVAGSNVLDITAGSIVNADINASAAIALSKLAPVAGLSVIGNASGSSAVPAAITGTGNQVLRVNEGGSVGFGNIFGSVVIANSMNLDRLSDGLGLSVIGRSASFAGPYADISAAADFQVLRRSGLSLDFGAINLASSAAVDGRLSLGNLANGGAVGNVLLAGATDPAWGTINLADTDSVGGLLPLANVTGGTAVGQVLRNTSGNIPAWGALDLSDTDAIVNRLPIGNIANGTTGRVLVAGASDPIWSTSLGNTSDVFSVIGSTFSVDAVTALNLQVAGGVMLSATQTTVGGPRILGICGNVTSAQMPSGTGDGVAFWQHGSGPTSGKSIGGGIIWSDAIYGINHKSDLGVESTIAPTAAALSSKRRIIDFKTPLEEITTIGGPNYVCQFKPATIGGIAFGNGILTVRAKCHAFGTSSYPGYCEWIGTIRMNSGTLTLVDHGPAFSATIPGVHGTGILSPSIIVFGPSIIFQANPFFAGMKFAGYFEVLAMED